MKYFSQRKLGVQCQSTNTHKNIPFRKFQNTSQAIKHLYLVVIILRTYGTEGDHQHLRLRQHSKIFHGWSYPSMVFSSLLRENYLFPCCPTSSSSSCIWISIYQWDCPHSSKLQKIKFHSIQSLLMLFLEAVFIEEGQQKYASEQ